MVEARPRQVLLQFSCFDESALTRVHYCRARIIYYYSKVFSTNGPGRRCSLLALQLCAANRYSPHCVSLCHASLFHEYDLLTLRLGRGAMLHPRLLSRAHLPKPFPRSCRRSQPSLPWKRRVCPLSSSIHLQQHLVTSDRTSHRQLSSKADVLEKIKPEAVQRPDNAKSIGPKTDALLTEQTVSNKEQRKADWAIMKEMVQYLWPKVA